MAADSTQDASQQNSRALTRTRIGVVTKDSREKTRTVAVSYQVRHPKYGKFLRRQSRFHVHDPQNVSKVGDRVEIANCRPVSKTKSWRLVKVLQAAEPPIEIVSGV